VALELLEPYIVDPRSRQFYTIARNCSNLMAFLVKDILDYAEIQEKPLVLNYESVNIFVLITECIEMLILKAI